MPEEWKKDTSNHRWVSTKEIDDILFQEDDAHRNFYFYGAVPNDFMDCEVSNLCSFNLKRHIKNKHKRIAAVFNTDDHNKDGQHWIAFYVDVDGDSNTVNFTGSGYAGGYFYLDQTGNSRTFNVTQGSTLVPDWLKITSVGNSGTVCVVQNDQGTSTSC